MRKLFLITAMLAVGSVMLLSCKKGETGPEGPAGADGPAGPAGPAGPIGTANVIYSSWYAPATTDWKDTAIGLPGPVKRALVSAPSITLSVLQKCAVLAYTAFDPVGIARTYQLPTIANAGASGMLTIGYVTEAGKMIYYIGKSDGTAPTVTLNTTYQFRYVIIPGGVAGRGVDVTYNGFTLEQLKSMPYEQVAAIFNIPATGSNM